MSQSFDVVFSSSSLDLFNVLFSIRKRLEHYGFHHGPSISRIEPEEEEIEVPFEFSSASSVTEWKGASTTFSGNGLSLDVAIDKFDLFSNVSVQTAESLIRRVYRERRFAVYVAALVNIAHACQAEGGVGGYNFSPGPLGPDDIVGTLMNNPEKPGYPADMGLVRQQRMSRNVIEDYTSGHFRVQDMPPYWALIGLEFEELLSMKI